MPLLSDFGPWWFGWVWSLLSPHPEWSSHFPPNTHAFKQRRWHNIPTTLSETIWNGSVDVSMSTTVKVWPYGSLVCLLVPFLQRRPAPEWLLASVRQSSSFCCFCCDMMFVYVARLGCWAVRQCCPAWPWCRPTTSQARRKWCHPWATGTGPALRASKCTHNTVTTTTDTSFTMDNLTTATWAILQPAAAPHWWERFRAQQCVCNVSM